MQNIKITKRNGQSEPLQFEKIHKVLEWAAENITGVSVSDIEMASNIMFYNGITTQEIHQTLVKACSDLISETTPNYDKVAARLINFDLRKKVYGDIKPDAYRGYVHKMVKDGRYTDELISAYSDHELDQLNKHIKHDRDYDFHYAGMMQMMDKYLVQNRSTSDVFESPQMAYMSISAVLFMNTPKEERISKVVAYYDAISTFKISIPSPILAGVRTPTKQFSSCVLIEADDSLDSIFDSAKAIGTYISKKAGIGINAKIRAEDSEIRGGEVRHTGSIPFFKHFQTAVKSCSQGGIRGGAATCHVWGLHKDFRDLIVLKNNEGTEDNRVRHMDYCVQLHRIHFERLLKGQDITLLSPHLEGLYESYFEADDTQFRTIYEKYENDPAVDKEIISAKEFFDILIQERKKTGRVYILNAQNANINSPYKENIKQSNLCVEIAQKVVPIKSVEAVKPFNKSLLDDPETISMYDSDQGLIALCTLSAVNMGKVKYEELEEICDLAVEALDNLLDYQEYPMLASAKHTQLYRPLGVGVINFAYWLAKNGYSYSDGSANQAVHEWFEKFQYSLLKASARLAKERGCCDGYIDSKYYDSIIPCIDIVNKNLSKIVDVTDLKCDWDQLRSEIVDYGVRNITLSALMPSESSSQLSNATNGIEPVRDLVTVKGSKSGTLKQVVPEIGKLKNKYEKLWDQKSPRGYLDLVAIMQRFVDQSISTNTSYNPNLYPDGKIPMSVLIKDLVYCYGMGVKTLYYFNTNDQVSLSDTEDDDCDSCKI